MKGPQKYRSKGRIFADILRAVADNGPAKVTHVLYQANLSHDRLTKYLVQLEESGLIVKEQDGDRAAYSITDKGTRFIAEFRKMEDFADAFGLDI
ncbi:MAG: winged helix-turn-helix transcriptional regulator [Methanomassiliicoccus sp.]|nr:winged helix-turn-helix transcriptional regulator [Methanomassiliicoccus sp.]